MELGFTQFHFSNTLPVVSGGLSGPTLRPYVLRLIETTRKIFGDDIELLLGVEYNILAMLQNTLMQVPIMYLLVVFFLIHLKLGSYSGP